MHYIAVAILSALAAQTHAYALQVYEYPAVPQATNQPLQVTYQATLQTSKPGQGYVAGTTNANGTGVEFNIGFTELPDQGPFAYHIHMNPVPEDGNCTAAGPHVIQPDGPIDGVPCNTTAPQFCQIGDLSGKHGKIVPENNKFSADYMDLYVATANDNFAFLGNRSLVLHNTNGTRINCGNFVLQHNTTGPSHSANSTMTSVHPSPTATESQSPSTGAAGAPSSPSSPSSSPSQYPSNSGSILDKSVSIPISIIVVAFAANMCL